MGFATATSEIVGKQARRRLVAGKPIPLSSLLPPFAVRRGASIAAIYEEDGFAIATTLIALQDGVVGDVIDARNAVSGTIVQGVIAADGTLALEGR
jgi:flagella basal body P-ring formation protein FlgA